MPKQILDLLADLRDQYKGLGETVIDDPDYQESSDDDSILDSLFGTFEEEDRDFDITKTDNSII